MLQNIHIQNFRCFEDFEANGFERINLIGGKNNSGKTCLLEGIFFGNAVQQPKFVIVELRDQRNAAQDFEFYKNVSYQKRIKPIIIQTVKDGEIYKLKTIYPFDNSEINFPSKEWEAGRVNYHRTSFTLNNKDNISNFKIIELFNDLNEEKKDKICLLLQNILEIKINKISTEDELIQISTPNNKLPIYYFGDALQNIFKYLVSFFSSVGGWKNKILLIDEIENGIHYSVHYDLWKNLFKLSKELNVQIFATTHSLEMIQQFNKVAKEAGEGAYFEMFRNEEENKIKCIKHEADILEYELETKENFRGEQI